MNVSLKYLGSRLSEGVEDDDPIVGLIENLRDTFKTVIEIELEEIAECVFRFKEVQLASFDAANYHKYLYRGGGTSGIGVTLTCKLGKPNPKDKKIKTPKEFAATALRKKVAAYLKSMGETADGEDTLEFGKAAFAALSADDEEILSQMTALAENIIPTREDSIITLVITSGGARKYPREVDALRDFFLQCVNPETREQKGLSSIGVDAVCSCCGKKNKKVFCQPQTLPYFTVDKPGFVAGGFFNEDELRRKGWRNFPLCSECVLKIRRGFKSAEDKLRFSLSRVNYLLIPNFIDWNSPHAVAIVDSLTSLERGTDASAQRDQEEIFVHRLAREENTASFTFIFYRKKQSRMEILSTLENVLPSRMSELADAVDRTNGHRLLAHFGDWARVPKIPQVEAKFGLLRALYQPWLKTKGDQPVSRFLGAVQRVVYGRPFDSKEFFDAAMRYIRDVLREQQSQGDEPWLVLSVHQCLAVAFWLLELNLLNLAHITKNEVVVGGRMMTNYPELNDADLNSRFDDFFALFGGLFAREEQCASYLMGVLCAQVLSAQRRRFENRQPFFRNLKDLHLDETEIRGLLPKLKSKLVEYDIDHFNWGLEKSIGERFRRAGSPWKLTTSEINFFFTLGLCEAPLFTRKPRDKETNEAEEEQ